MCRTHCVLALVVLYVGLAHSWDFALTNGDLLEFYTNANKADTVRFNSQNLAALAYDEVHNVILYVDKQSDNDAICGYDISSMQYKYLTERNGKNIQGLAFDPVTELLFFTDTSERSINWISLKPGSKNNVNGNVLIKMDDGIPTDIAVDSCRGYIYWMTTNLKTPTIERARFNGSEREVVINPSLLSINTTHKLEPHSLAIDQETQKIYWIEPETSSLYHICQADLNGKNKDDVIYFKPVKVNFPNERLSNRLTVSKETLFQVDWLSDNGYWGHTETELGKKFKSLITAVLPAGIATNFKVLEQIQGLQDCKALTSRMVRNNFLTESPFKSATEYDGPFCVHGVKVNGQFLCKCTPGYTGERCDVSVCANYCIQGYCSFGDVGLPTCRCNTGYSGERCEVNECYGYCLNNGDCSLNEKSEPVCQCKEDYVGDRCDVSECLNYCIQGNCSFNDEGLPTCRCNTGYSGERCEVNACYGYCLNNGDCSLNEKSEPVCHCKEDYVGDRCDVSECLNYCIHGNCSFDDEGIPTCRCNAGYTGERCEVNACYGYCLNNGNCSLNEEDEPFCECVDTHEGSRCEAVKNGSPKYSSAERNLTLADIFSNWRKPISKISVIIESS